MLLKRLRALAAGKAVPASPLSSLTAGAISSLALSCRYMCDTTAVSMMAASVLY